MRGAADDGHQQILDRLVEAEGRRVHAALHVHVEPAGEAREHGGIDEGEQAGARGIDAEARRRHRAALQSADGAAGPAVEQVHRRQRRQQHAEPDHGETHPRVEQAVAGHLQRRDAGNPVIAADQIEIGEGVVEADAPGDGAEREVVAGEAHRHRADQRGAGRRHQQPGGQAEPGREVVVFAHDRGGVGAEAEQGGLTERGHAADAGQHHQADRHDGGDAGIVQQRHPEGRHAGDPRHQASERDAGEGPELGEAGAGHSSSSPFPCRRERHSSTGMMAVKTITSLKALAQKEEKLSATPTSSAASTAPG